MTVECEPFAYKIRRKYDVRIAVDPGRKTEAVKSKQHVVRLAPPVSDKQLLVR